MTSDDSQMKNKNSSDIDDFLNSLHETNETQSYRGYLEYSGAAFILTGICFSFELLTIPGIILVFVTFFFLFKGVKYFESKIKISRNNNRILKLSSLLWGLLIGFLHYSHFMLVFFDQKRILVSLYSLLAIIQSITYFSIYIFLKQINKAHLYRYKTLNWIFLLYAISGYVRIAIYLGYNFREISYYIVNPIDGILLVIIGVILIRDSILTSRHMSKTQKDKN
ncbi:MAG: hypothetical protein HGN29_17555 [Asgard group archaeon]|nr:hypothetical protein [Asgard group archaeon]